jgi:hypothetical protein
MKKKLYILAFLLTASLSLMAQDKKSLEERVGKMYEYTATKQYEKLTDLTYPKLFTIIPREKMVEALGAMSKGDGFTINIMNTPPNFKFGEIRKIEDGRYCVIAYDLNMKMIFVEPIAADEVDMLLATFKEALKTNDVTFDIKDNSINIKKKAQAVGVSDKLSNNQWTFINNSDGPIKGKVFSEKVVKELGI